MLYPLQPRNSLGSLALLILLGFFQACTLSDSSQPSAYFRLEATPQLITYGRVVILLSDTLGNRTDTLYQDTLRSLSPLKRLPADGYTGGPVLIKIHGYRNGVLVYAESRIYDGEKQRVLSLNIAKDLPVIPLGTPPGSNPSTQVPPTVPPVVVALAKSPSVVAFPSDTLVSVKDSVALHAEAFDSDGDLASYAWHCDGDGKAEDTAALSGSRQKIWSGTKFTKPGLYTCTLRLWDKTGRHSETSTEVQVVYDMPIADAGQDTIVIVNTKIFLHAKGTDIFGPIVSRAWKIGKLDFVEIMQQETSILAPDLPGDLPCILRVMDSDSLMAYDTLMVTVKPKPADTLPILTAPSL
jgi:hypothetical protein